MPVGLGELHDADQALGEELGDGEVESPARRAFGGRVLGDPGAGRVLGVGLGHVGPGPDLLVVHHRGQEGTSSSSSARRTNRSVLMEMSGKVLVMRRSVTVGTSGLGSFGPAELPSMQHEATELHHGVHSE